MKGTIRKITLENFITYEYVEIIPGRHMNMIIGPNGSGKSSVLCGICLGLAGRPKSIGRVTKVGDYVKTGCNEATIHIELDKGEGNDRVTIVTRIINKAGNSSWSVNGKQVTQREVEETVANMSIHMDNLCQFLSQERVQDFTKMNSKELLLNTEKTVGTSEMYAYHMRLVEMCKDTQGQTKNVAQLTTNLEREVQKHQDLQDRMQSMTERLELMDSAKKLRYKKPWIEYNDQLASIKEVAEDHQKACDELAKRRKALVPVEKVIKAIQTRLQGLKEELKVKVDHFAVLNRAVDTQDTATQQIAENQRHLNDQIRTEEKRLKDIKLVEQKLAATEQELQKAIAEHDPEKNKKELHALQLELQTIEEVIKLKRSEVDAKKLVINEKDAELRELVYQIGAMTCVENKRLNVLKNMDADAHKASVWVRKNADRFKGKVYGSLLLEISMYDANDSKYLEVLIAYRDKKALLCERADTMNEIVPILKRELNVKINMLQSPDEKPDVHQVSRSELKRLGFERYVTDLFQCPLPIFNYLCRTLRLHEIPIAASENKVNINEAQQKFNRFFAGDKLFSVSKSKFSGNYTTRVITIGGSGLFANSVDSSAVEQVEARKAHVTAEKEQAQQKVTAIQEELKAQEAKKDKIRRNRQELNQKGDKIKEITITRNKYRTKIDLTAKHAVNIETVKAKCEADNKEILRKAFRELSKLADLMQKVYAQQTQMSLLLAEERGLLSRQMVKEEELTELRNGMKELENQITTLKQIWSGRKSEGRRLLEVAKKVTGCAPGEPAFDQMQEMFNTLPKTVHEIECAIKDIEGRLEFFGNDDENIVEDVAQQEALVAKLRQQLKDITNSCENRKAEIQALKNKWLPPLQKLAQDISKKFEKLFEYMKCVGEVVLVEGDPEVENDFENYGLQIRVKFRENEQLQELCGTQSGGERSVSTAIYLLALQELTQVPFRCMDEINQGMDPTNERRIMNLMMQMSDKEDSCQYFVVTPKLLPNLTYADSAMVMCVSQPSRMDTSKWSMANFLASAKKRQGVKRQKTA